MDAIEMLASQHRRATDLLREVESATGEPRRKLFLELADALTIHAAIEERYFYPAVYGAHTEEILLAELDQHIAIKRALAEALRADTASEAFAVGLQRLGDEVARHVGDEEQDLFPRVAVLLDQHQLDSLAHLMTGAMDDLEDPELRAVTPDENDRPHPAP
jgi:hemerythrin superfamily protein